MKTAPIQGRRLPDWQPPKPSLVPPGCQHYDYWINKSTGFLEVFIPRFGIGVLKGHQITEHEDGSISVTPTIVLEGFERGVTWRGDLKHGWWENVNSQSPVRLT